MTRADDQAAITITVSPPAIPDFIDATRKCEQTTIPPVRR
jgi:hypothetical protein